MSYYDVYFDKLNIKCIYFSENIFGDFIISELLDYKIEINFNNIKINNININLKNNILKEYKYKNKYVYVIILNSKLDLESDNLDSLSINNLYNLKDLLIILSKIRKLPSCNYIVSNVQDYISSIEEIKNKHLNEETFFRGQYSYKHILIPSLFRNKNYYNNESNMYMDFKNQYYNELSHKKYIEILTTMQHYKMPTRLLDTTSNPLVALYMALDRPEKIKFDLGEVVIMNTEKSNVKYSDSNIITILSSLSVLETDIKIELFNVIKKYVETNDPNVYLNSLAYKKFKAEVCHELPLFDEAIFDPKVLLKPRHVKVGMINERIIAQAGSFILFGLVDYSNINSDIVDTNTKERVFVINRDYILKQLELLNINQSSMYPDKDHTAKTITKSYDD